MRRRFGRMLALSAGLLVLGSACAVDRSRPATRVEVLQRILPAAAQVVVEREGRRVRSGSGVVIAVRESLEARGCYVMTSGHTLSRKPEEEVYVVLGRGRKVRTKVRAAVLARRETADLDLGLLRLAGAPCSAARVGEPPALGDPILVVAFPWGRQLTLVSGIVSQVTEDGPGSREPGPRMMVDASVSYGASGGGVFDAGTGRLVGLVDSYRTARVTFNVDARPSHIDVPVPGETVVVPLTDLRRFLLEVGHADLMGPGDAVAGPQP
ncbi:MAG: S1 family peptidase [Candidatus Rokuibacteriota bacterium]